MKEGIEVKEEIFSQIDDIIQESEMSMLCALATSYCKALTILDNYNESAILPDGFEIFQEAASEENKKKAEKEAKKKAKQAKTNNAQPAQQQPTQQQTAQQPEQANQPAQPNVGEKKDSIFKRFIDAIKKIFAKIFKRSSQVFSLNNPENAENTATDTNSTTSDGDAAPDTTTTKNNVSKFIHLAAGLALFAGLAPDVINGIMTMHDIKTAEQLFDFYKDTLDTMGYDQTDKHMLLVNFGIYPDHFAFRIHVNYKDAEKWVTKFKSVVDSFTENSYDNKTATKLVSDFPAVTSVKVEDSFMPCVMYEDSASKLKAMVKEIGDKAKEITQKEDIGFDISAFVNASSNYYSLLGILGRDYRTYGIYGPKFQEVIQKMREADPKKLKKHAKKEEKFAKKKYGTAATKNDVVPDDKQIADENTHSDAVLDKNGNEIK